MSDNRKRGAILISGRGSNMVSLLRAAQHEDFPVEFTAVISDKIEAPGLSIATSAGIKTHALRRCRDGRDAWEEELHDLLTEAEIDLVCLAGFMRLLSPAFVAEWEGRILNIHPSLLPKYKGLNTHARAIEAGDDTAGCSVHMVTADLDDGPILGQSQVPIHVGDTPETLAARVLEQEHILYPQLLRKFLSDMALPNGGFGA